MRNFSLFVVFLIGVTSGLLTLFVSSVAANPLPIPAKVDSISILDSLVNRNKVSNNTAAIRYAGKALIYAENHGTLQGLIRAYMLMGEAFKKNYKDSSFIYYSKALKLSYSGYEKERSNIFLNLALIYKSALDMNKAFQYIDSSITFAQKTKNSRVMSDAYNILGNIKKSIQDKDARAMYDSAFNIAQRYSLYKQMGNALGNLAKFDTNVRESIKKHKEALGYLQKSQGSEEEMAQILINIGFRYPRPDSALFYFTRALELAKLGKFPETEVGAYNNMAYSYMDMGNLAMAEICVQNAIPIAELDINHDWLSTLYDTYADILNTKGEYKRAVQLQKKAMSERVAGDKKQSAGQVRLLAALLDTKNKEMLIQNKENELLLQRNRLQTTRFWLVLAVILIIAVSFVFYWFQQRSRMKLKNEEVNSAKRLIEMEESEKGRIARELHDITGQLIMGITGEIENLDIPASKVKEEIKEKIKVLGKSIRQISHRMNRAMLEHFTFEELMNGQCEDIQKLTGIPIFLTLPENQVDLSREVVSHLHRIVQELLTNAGKYAKDGEVYIVFSNEPNGIKLSYSDTGPGFDTEKTELKGMGLLNIFERTKLLGGTAKMKSSPGNGTSWDVFIPLAKN